METGLRVLLLTAALALGGCASVRGWFHREGPVEETPPTAAKSPTNQSETPPRVIEPQVERRKVKIPKIHSENVEIGGYFGGLSIEDFGTNGVYGITAAYHITEDFFLRADIGRSTAGKTSFETLGGNVQLLTSSERRFTYYDIGLGYNFLPGEVFLGRDVAMNSSFYLVGGIGSTKFAGDQRFTLSFGAGYRVVPRDRFAIHFTVQDRVFESDLLGKNKLTNNLEARLGATVFF